MKVVAPVRCPHCRSRLTTKALSNSMARFYGLAERSVRWCKQCKCTVSYIDDADNWYQLGAITED